jgi:hypothetical protein
MMIINFQCRTETAIWAGAATPPPTPVDSLLSEDGQALLSEDGQTLIQE